MKLRQDLFSCQRKIRSATDLPNILSGIFPGIFGRGSQCEIRGPPMRAHQIMPPQVVTVGAASSRMIIFQKAALIAAWLKMMNQCPRLLYLSVAIALFTGSGAVAQNAENGQRLSERWCSQCHAIGPVPGKFKGVPSFASIANREIVTPEMIASFLRMPHATMPNFPLSRKDAQDISAFITGMKK